MNKNNIEKILTYLEKLFPDAKCELIASNPVHFLVAVMLSAQCTDKRVNLTTPPLFEKYKTAYDFANANLAELEQMIKPCGFYHNKAKNIISACKSIVEKYDGVLPNTVNELMTLSGVGMKTAKVVCGDLFSANVIAVDTHVLRVSNRLGIVNELNPEKVSVLLENIFKNQLHRLHHRLVLFGRYYCKAIKPLCQTCELKDICKFYKSNH